MTPSSDLGSASSSSSSSSSSAAPSAAPSSSCTASVQDASSKSAPSSPGAVEAAAALSPLVASHSVTGVKANLEKLFQNAGAPFPGMRPGGSANSSIPSPCNPFGNAAPGFPAHRLHETSGLRENRASVSHTSGAEAAAAAAAAASSSAGNSDTSGAGGSGASGAERRESSVVSRDTGLLKPLTRNRVKPPRKTMDTSADAEQKKNESDSTRTGSNDLVADSAAKLQIKEVDSKCQKLDADLKSAVEAIAKLTAQMSVFQNELATERCERATLEQRVADLERSLSSATEKFVSLPESPFASSVTARAVSRVPSLKGGPLRVDNEPLPST